MIFTVISHSRFTPPSVTLTYSRTQYIFYNPKLHNFLSYLHNMYVNTCNITVLKKLSCFKFNTVVTGCDALAKPPVGMFSQEVQDQFYCPINTVADMHTNTQHI